MLARNKIAIVVVGVAIAVVTAYETATSDAVVSRTLRSEFAKGIRAPCSFRSASFTFLHGLEVRGLTVLDPADPLGVPLLAAEYAHVNYVLDVLGAGPHVTRVDVEKPRLRIERAADGSFPAAHAFFFPPPEGPAAPKPHVHLSGGEVTFADATILRETLALHDIEIDVAPAAPKTTDWAHAVVHLTATSDVLGPLSAELVVGDTTEHATVVLDLPRTRIDPSLPARFAGDIGRRIAGLAPTGELTAHVRARLEPGKDFAADAMVEIRDVSLTVALPEAAAGQPAPAPVQITKLNGRLHFADDRLEARGLSLSALGAEFRADATLDAVTQPAPRLDAKVEITALPLTRDTRACVPSVVRRILTAYDITGTVDATATVVGALSAPAVAVRARIRGGHVRYDGYEREDGTHYGFPWPAEDVDGTVEVDSSGVRVDATARHGPARVKVKVAVTDTPAGESVPDVSILAEEVPLDDALRRSFEDGGEAVFGKWGPSGIAKSVAVHVYRVAGATEDHDVIDVTVDCDGRAAFLPRIVPVPLHDATGRVEILQPVVDGHRATIVRLTGVTAKADGFDVRVEGEVRESPAGASEDLVVKVDTPDAGGPARAALFAADDGTIAPGVKDAVRKLGASGPIGVVAHLVKTPDAVRHDEVAIALLGTSVTGWDDIPLAARALTGRAVVADDTLTFEDVAGFFVMGDSAPAFTGRGRLLQLSGEPRFDVHVESPKIPLGEPLRAALGPLAEKAKAFWTEIDPVGDAHAALVLDLRPDPADPRWLEVTMPGLHGVVRPLGLELDCDDGTLHYDGVHAEVTGLDAAIGAAVVRVDHADFDVASGRVTVNASFRGLHFPEDLEGLLGAGTVARIVAMAPGRTAHASDVVAVYDPELRALELAGNVIVKPRTRRILRDPGLAPEGTLEIARLVFYLPNDEPPYFQGEAAAEGFSLRAGLAIDRFKGPLEISGTLGAPAKFRLRAKGATFRLQDYPLTDATVVVETKPRGVHVDLGAKFMDGDLDGWCGPGKDDVSYQGEFTLKGADLEKTIRDRSAGEGQVATGKLDADVKFQIVDGPRGGLRGAGNFTAHDARLMESPVIGAVMRLLSLGTYTPVFTDAALKFDLAGDQFVVKDVQVTGPGVNASIAGGEGTIGFADGRLDVVVYPIIDIGLPVISEIAKLFQKQASPYRVRLTGTLRNPKAESTLFARSGSAQRREPQPEGDVEAPARDPW